MGVCPLLKKKKSAWYHCSWCLWAFCGPPWSLHPVPSCYLSVVPSPTTLILTHTYSRSPSTGNAPATHLPSLSVHLQHMPVFWVQVAGVCTVCRMGFIFCRKVMACLSPGFYHQLEPLHESVNQTTAESKLEGVMMADQIKEKNQGSKCSQQAGMMG